MVLQAPAAAATGESSLLKREGQGAILLATWQEHRTAQALAQAQAAAAHSRAAQMEAEVSGAGQAAAGGARPAAWHTLQGSARSWSPKFAAAVLDGLCCLQKASAYCFLQLVDAGAACWLSPSCRGVTPAPVSAGPQAVGSSPGGGAGAAGVAARPAAVRLGQVRHDQGGAEGGRQCHEGEQTGPRGACTCSAAVRGCSCPCSLAC